MTTLSLSKKEETGTIESLKNARYYSVAIEAFIRVQNKSAAFIESRKVLKRILADDPWWAGLSGTEHQQVGRFIARHDWELHKICANLGIDAPYWYRKNEGDRTGTFYQEILPKEPELIYHYTSLGSMVKILDSGQLRLMNSDYMNDFLERSYFRNGVQEYLKRTVAGDSKAESRLESFFDDYDKNFDCPAYLTSFSRKPDDAAQWERYANKGNGVAIGFAADVLRKMIVADGRLILADVTYGDDFANAYIVNDIENYVRSRVGTIAKIKESLYLECATHKHSSFDSEMEVRLFTSKVSFPTLNQNLVQFECNNRMREAYHFNWEEKTVEAQIKKDDLIKSICIGPTADFGIQLLEKYIYKQGLNAHISKSECPLRVM